MSAGISEQVRAVAAIAKDGAADHEQLRTKARSLLDAAEGVLEKARADGDHTVTLRAIGVAARCIALCEQLERPRPPPADPWEDPWQMAGQFPA